MWHPLINLVNTTLSQKHGDPQLKGSIYGSVPKSSLYISSIPVSNWKLPILIQNTNTGANIGWRKISSTYRSPTKMKLQRKCANFAQSFPIGRSTCCTVLFCWNIMKNLAYFIMFYHKESVTKKWKTYFAFSTMKNQSISYSIKNFIVEPQIFRK